MQAVGAAAPPAVGEIAGVQVSITLAADHLVAVVISGPAGGGKAR